jgi:exosome complex RNA-binding protein Rrp42 (RNase PH superfamily)
MLNPNFYIYIYIYNLQGYGHILSLAHLRTDGRRYDELRTIKHKLTLFNGSDGSAYLEQGNLT